MVQVRVFRCALTVRSVYALRLFGAIQGPGLARDAFLNVEIGSPGPQCHVSYNPSDESMWLATIRHPIAAYFQLRDGRKLAPYSRTTPVQLSLAFRPPFTAPFRFILTYGHGVSPTVRVPIVADAESLSAAHHAVLANMGVDAEELRRVAFAAAP